MKKTGRFLGLGVLVLGFILTVAPVAIAADIVGSFPVSVTITPSSGVNFVVSRVDSSNNFTPNGSNNLTFPVTLTNGVYLPNYTFAIDLASTNNGAGNPSVLIQYANIENPNSDIGRKGLESKGVCVAQKVVGATGSQTVTNLKSATLGDMNNTTISKADLSGGYMRVLVGLATGCSDPTKCIVDPTGAEPFTNADEGGTYTGTLTLTASLP